MISAESKMQILELFSRFAHCSDYGDWDNMTPLFVPNVVTEFADYDFRYEGVDAQIGHAKDSDRVTGGKNRHYYLNFFIDGDEHEAVVRYFFLNTHAGDEPMGAKLVTSGRMRDTVVNTPEGWRIARRFVTFDQQFEMQANM